MILRGGFLLLLFGWSFFGGEVWAQIIKREEPAIVRPSPEGRKDWLSLQIDDPLQALVAADLDGDGRPELVGVTESEVIAYRMTGSRFLPFARREDRERFVRYLRLEAADINGNGREEVFITALTSVPRGLHLRNSLRSFVLELQGNRLVPIAEDLPYFLRVVSRPGRDPSLLAQKMGEFTPFEGPVLQMIWDGGGYREEVPLSLPYPASNLYEFAPVDGVEVAVLAKTQIKVYRGGVIWEGDRLGEVDHMVFLQTPKDIRFPTGLRSGPPPVQELAEKRFLPRRLLVIDPLFGDGEVELVTVANGGQYGFRLPFTKEDFYGGQVIAYIRRGGTYVKSWETTPVEGKALDFAIGDFTKDGRREIVLLTGTKEKGRSTVHVFFPEPRSVGQ